MKTKIIFSAVILTVILFNECKKSDPAPAPAPSAPSNSPDTRIYNKWQVVSGLSPTKYLLINSNNSVYQLDSAASGKTVTNATALITSTQISWGVLYNYSFSSNSDTLKLSNMNGTAILKKNINAPSQIQWLIVNVNSDSAEIVSASDNALAERTSDDVTNMAGQASENGSMSSYRLANGASGADILGLGCATVSFDTIINRRITITFNGSSCMDGHTRSGSINVDFSGSTNGAKYFRNPGYKAVVISSNYVVDGNAVTISKTITNTTPIGFNPAITNETWSDSTALSVVKSNGAVFWTANKVRILLNTSDTNVYHGQTLPITCSNAIIGVTGNATGTDAAGENFTTSITSQLVRDFGCAPNTSYPGQHPFINGTLDFTPGTKATRHIDYGYPNSGACDDQALVTIGTYTVSITLP